MAGRRTGATGAAMLPAALAGAALVSAPFAGTSTAPLATSRPQAATSTAATAASTTTVAQRAHHGGVGPGDLAMLGGAEALLLGVGAGVIVYARRRSS